MLKFLDPTWPKVASALLGTALGLIIITFSFVVAPMIWGNDVAVWSSYGILTVATAIQAVHIWRRMPVRGLSGNSILVSCCLCLFMWVLTTVSIFDGKMPR